ncbi:MAG TPA: carboxypeptidase regulatory-like domain-containing protein, partial [Bryobacteraceae bacterium]|nr:carboxypeptidase regulatory-like domain-containing protein [Bryobacteraceae bacterium]
MQRKARYLTRSVFALALCCGSLLGQTISSSLVGTVVDPADAAVANAPVTLTDVATKAERNATTDNTGTYRFLSIDPGTYNITVKAPGFKALTQTNIVISASETHNGGKMVLQLGNVSESISVTAEAAQVQLSSSEKAQTVDASNLESLTLKGRDLFGYMKLVPGVIDTSTTRDVTSPGAIGGITINGNTSAKNFTVDGITDIDTGSNGTLHYEPNLDSIQELKVLTSNYQAEFGRNSGGTITVVTKSGTQEFHGTAAWNHRHEEFNADSWANNHTLKNGAATPRVPYRYNVETYSIGGPAYIPKVANKEKKHLFFFWSQEYTGQYVAGATQTL